MVLRQLKNWGCPWHGLIRNGQLHLPNAQTMPFAQSQSSYWGMRWATGNALLLQMPWAQSPPRTTEQQASDAAAGMQWADYALLSGEVQRLHGTGELYGWIYACPQGKPWAIDIRPSSDFTDWEAEATLFGHTLSQGGAVATAATIDPGQSSPELDLSGSGGIGQTLMDILPDGSKAIVMLHASLEPFFDVDLIGVTPLGFIEVTLTGSPLTDDFAVSVSVLRSRAQTLGSVTRTGAETEPEQKMYSTAMADRLSIEIDTSNANFDNCTGYVDQTQTPVSVPEKTPTDGADAVPVAIVSDSWTDTVTGRVLSMHYAAGSPVAVVLNFSHHTARQYDDLQQTITGVDHQRTHLSGGPGVCDRTTERISHYTHTLTRRELIERWTECAITDGERSISWRIELSDERTWRRVFSSDTATQGTWNQYDQSLTAGDYSATDSWELKETIPWLPSWLPAQPGRALWVDTPDSRARLPQQHALGGAGANARLECVRYCCHAVGLVLRWDDPTLSSEIQQKALTPTGSASSSPADVTAVARSSWPVRGAYNPATGAAVLFTDDTVSYT